MAKGDLTKIVLKDVRQKEHQLTRIAAPEIHELFKESVYDSLIGWYSDYTPAWLDVAARRFHIASENRTLNHHLIPSEEALAFSSALRYNPAPAPVSLPPDRS